jgi:hypothetical protein
MIDRFQNLSLFQKALTIVGVVVFILLAVFSQASKNTPVNRSKQYSYKDPWGKEYKIDPEQADEEPLTGDSLTIVNDEQLKKALPGEKYIFVREQIRIFLSRMSNPPTIVAVTANGQVIKDGETIRFGLEGTKPFVRISIEVNPNLSGGRYPEVVIE